MLVCHCAVVNDAAVTRAIDDGARTVAEITAACGAGGGCGGCRPTLCRLLGGHEAGACGAPECPLAALVSTP